jgi:serine/threonine protein kinase
VGERLADTLPPAYIWSTISINIMSPHSRPEDRGPSAPVFNPGQIVSGRYRIERFLNRGGMGEVYEVEDLELRQRIALKTLLPEIADTRSIARFKQEINLSRKLVTRTYVGYSTCRGIPRMVPRRLLFTS